MGTLLSLVFHMFIYGHHVLSPTRSVYQFLKCRCYYILKASSDHILPPKFKASSKVFIKVFECKTECEKMFIIILHLKKAT